MSLNQKYTWNDFLSENPEFKEKKIKRTSAEAKKAFEAAFKAKVKDILKDRLGMIDKETTRVMAEKKELSSTIKALKRVASRRPVEAKIARKDRYVARLARQSARTKEVQKNY